MYASESRSSLLEGKHGDSGDVCVQRINVSECWREKHEREKNTSPECRCV